MRRSRWFGSGGSAVHGLLRRLCDPSDVAAATLVALCLLTCEAVLCPLIVWAIPYTEVDWEAYMQQSVTFLQGERDYQSIRGDTGPLVYPAGFLYLFSVLRSLTGGGDIAAAQAVFAAMYLATQAAALALYVHSKAVPPWALVLLTASKRLHSVYLLRLFNDGAATCVAHLALLALAVARRPVAAVALFSAAVSIKMHVLLMAPPVLVVLLRTATPRQVAVGTAAGTALQGALAAPFLAAMPASYIHKAFELSRVFLYRWTVNLRFLPEAVFQSRELAAGLLAAHVLLLGAFAQWRWAGPQGLAAAVRAFWARQYEQRRPGTGGQTNSRKVAAGGSSPNSHSINSGSIRGAGSITDKSGGTIDNDGGNGHNVGSARTRTGSSNDGEKGAHTKPSSAAGSPISRQLSTGEAVWIVWSGNFIGILCARTLHYQFYSWYCHSLPLLLWSTRLATWQRLGLWLCIEAVWNAYPPTALSSGVLLVCHCVLLLALWQRRLGRVNT